MVVFGGTTSGALFSHIPMFHEPHDVQAIFAVKLPHSERYAKGRYTFNPDRSSLNDLVRGTLKRLHGTIYAGNFEDGGKALEEIDVTIDSVLDARVLKSQPANLDVLTYRAYRSGSAVFLVHAITVAEDFDQIVRYKQTKKDLVTFPGRKNTLADRLRANEVEEILSTLVGPDFDHAPSE